MSCPYLHRCTASIHVIHFNAVEFCTFAFIFGDTSYEIQLLRRYYLKISFCIFTRCIWDNNINFGVITILAGTSFTSIFIFSYSSRVNKCNIVLWYGLSDVSNGRKMFKGCCGRHGVLYTVPSRDDTKKRGQLPRSIQQQFGLVVYKMQRMKNLTHFRLNEKSTTALWK